MRIYKAHATANKKQREWETKWAQRFSVPISAAKGTFITLRVYGRHPKGGYDDESYVIVAGNANNLAARCIGVDSKLGQQLVGKVRGTRLHVRPAGSPPDTSLIAKVIDVGWMCW